MNLRQLKFAIFILGFLFVLICSQVWAGEIRAIKLQGEFKIENLQYKAQWYTNVFIPDVAAQGVIPPEEFPAYLSSHPPGLMQGCFSVVGSCTPCSDSAPNQINNTMGDCINLGGETTEGDGPTS